MHQRKKLRLRDWLVQMINARLYGLRWEGDPKKRTFRVPWKHGSRHGWSVKDDAALFQAWAMYTGKYKEGRDKPDPRKWKTNFRCALNALPDIKEIREESCPRGKDAFKIYRMRPLRGRGESGISNYHILSREGAIILLSARESDVRYYARCFELAAILLVMGLLYAALSIQEFK